MGVRERKVENYFKKQVKVAGGLSRKWVSPGRDGVTDQIAIKDGRVYFVEIKTIDGVLSKNQEREHKNLRDVGAEVFTVMGEEGVDCWVREVLLA